jgi:hypothetical protein
VRKKDSFLAAVCQAQKLLRLCSGGSGGICVLLGSDGPIFYLAQLCNFGSGIAEDRSDASGLSVCVHECATFDVVLTFPADCEVGVGFLEIDGLGVPVAGKSCSELVGGIQHPGVSSLGRKERQQLFGGLLLFVYHCFDRIVLNGYLSGLSRPEQVVHFFRQIIGVPTLSKELLAKRTNDYQNWVEAFARNHSIPIEWAQKDVRKEDPKKPTVLTNFATTC